MSELGRRKETLQRPKIFGIGRGAQFVNHLQSEMLEMIYPLTKDSVFGSSLLAAVVIHLTAFICVSILMGHHNRLSTHGLIPISLLEPPQEKNTPRVRDEDTPVVEKKLEPASQRQEAQKPPQGKNQQATIAPPAPLNIEEQAAKSNHTETPSAPIERFLSERASEQGGAPAGAATLYSTGETGVTPGSGSAGGGGSAVAGLGRANGTPGLPAPSGPLRTNREAKPIQTARATYPPMALRMGMESDVTLRIEVDPAGNVTKAEITKSGGAGFDEEALKAVKQSRFEPAQRDGHSVPAEFIYIYRFRLHR